MEPERLTGGHINEVIRIGDAVHRSQGHRAHSKGPRYVHELLRHLENTGFDGAPRFLGIDDDGNEILSYVDGDVPHEPADESWVREPEALAEVARLVREFHDLTAGTPLAEGDEVVCHNDLSPRNTVYRRHRPVAFIDWDLAAPGRRIHDVAHVCWQFPWLGPQWTNPDHAARLVRVVCDGYGLDDRSEVVDAIEWWTHRCWTGIAEKAEAGEPAMQRLRDLGAVSEVRAAEEWVAANRDALQVALD